LKLLDVPYRIHDALKTTIVTKFVRGHLLIPALKKTFDIDILHLRRDPRAMAASFQRRGWQWHKTLCLKDQLLQPDDGRTAYFGQWDALIRKYDQADPLIRIAAYWILLEGFVDRIASRSGLTVLSYEDLCLNTEAIVDSVFQETTHPEVSVDSFQRDSATTDDTREGLSAMERVHSWKRELSPQHRSDIERAVEAFDMHRLLE
jgi:hypothetical protein